MRDAVTVIQVASQLEGQPPGWAEQLAEEFAACGEAHRAMELLHGRAGSKPVPVNEVMAALRQWVRDREIRGA